MATRAFKPTRTKPTGASYVTRKLVPGVGKPVPYKPRAGTKPGQGPSTGKPTLGPAPAKPAKPAVGQPARPDSTYEGTIDLVDRKETGKLGELDSQEQKIKHDFGIDDPTNPFSRAEGMKKLFLARQKGASVGLASQGKLYSGTHERALGRVRRQEEEARAGLRSAYEDAIGQIGSAKAGVKWSSEEEKNQAFEDWLARAPDADVALDDGWEDPSLREPSTSMGAMPRLTGSNAPGSGAGTRAQGNLPKELTSKFGRGQGADAGRGRGKVKPKRKPPVKPKGGRGSWARSR